MQWNQWNESESMCHVKPPSLNLNIPQIYNNVHSAQYVLISCESQRGTKLSPWVTQKQSRNRSEGQTTGTWASAFYRNLGDGDLWFLKTLEMGGFKSPLDSKNMRSLLSWAIYTLSTTLEFSSLDGKLEMAVSKNWFTSLSPEPKPTAFFHLSLQCLPPYPAAGRACRLSEMLPHFGHAGCAEDLKRSRPSSAAG